MNGSAGTLPVVISFAIFQVCLPPCVGSNTAVFLLLAKKSSAKGTFVVGLAIYCPLIHHTK